MNTITKEKLQEFIANVCLLAHAVSAVAGTDALKKLFDAADELHKALDKDETIP